MAETAITIIRRGAVLNAQTAAIQQLFGELDYYLVGIISECRGRAALATIALVEGKIPFVHLDRASSVIDCPLLLCDKNLENDHEIRKNYPEFYGAANSIELILLCRKDWRGYRHILQGEGGYVMRTSGTTSIGGKPVTVPLSNFLDNLNAISLSLEHRRMVGILISPFTFDPSLVELFLPLRCKYGKLIIPPESMIRAPDLLYDTIIAYKVSVLMMTPTLWMRFSTNQRSSLVLNSSIVHLVLGGEPFPLRFLKELRDVLRNVGACRFTRLWNIYGTTECSVWASLYEIPAPVFIAKSKSWSWPSIDKLISNGVPLGHSLKGTKIFVSIFKNNGRLLIPEMKFKEYYGAEGELWLGEGPRLCFVADKSEPDLHQSTGDIVRILEDGNIVFVGRADNVFKRNGQRIDPAVIEETVIKSLILLVEYCSCFTAHDKIIVAIFTNCDRNLLMEKLRMLEIPKAYFPDEFFILRPEACVYPVTQHYKFDKSEYLKRSRYRITMADLVLCDIPSNGSWADRLLTMYQTVLRWHGNKHQLFPAEENLYLLAEGGTSIDSMLIARKIESIVKTENDLLNNFGDFKERLVQLILHKPLTEVAEFVQSAIDATRQNQSISIERQKSEIIPDIIFREKWSVPMGKCVDSSPKIDGEKFIYVGSHSGKLACIDGYSGIERWSLILPDRIEASCEINEEESWIAIGCHDGSMYFVDSITGAYLAKFSTSGEIKSAAKISGAGSLVWFGSYNHVLYGIKYLQNKCVEKFRLCINQSTFANPISYRDHYVIFACTGGDVICIDSDSLKVQWRCRTSKSPIFATPVLVNNTLITINVAGAIEFIQPDTGISIRTISGNNMFPVFSSPVGLRNGYLVAYGTHQKSLCLLRMDKDKYQICTINLPDIVFSKPVVVEMIGDPHVIACCIDGSINVIRASLDGSLSLLGSYKMNNSQIFSSPAILTADDGTIGLILGCRQSDKITMVTLTAATTCKNIDEL